ncbi:unnamed protein product [Prorocentrum cordatum]|uniref:DNA2/NAM7 helicase helicase domain-containing protein n=1 Tax=Prorocentrum cordatum TaxID=2364126 RepID=A0ABN9XTK9_9DINO|nr:unnamed protein product [Polarella glacialis]
MGLLATRLGPQLPDQAQDHRRIISIKGPSTDDIAVIEVVRTGLQELGNTFPDAECRRAGPSKDARCPPSTCFVKYNRERKGYEAQDLRGVPAPVSMVSPGLKNASVADKRMANKVHLGHNTGTALRRRAAPTLGAAIHDPGASDTARPGAEGFPANNMNDIDESVGLQVLHSYNDRYVALVRGPPGCGRTSTVVTLVAVWATALRTSQAVGGCADVPGAAITVDLARAALSEMEKGPTVKVIAPRRLQKGILEDGWPLAPRALQIAMRGDKCSDAPGPDPRSHLDPDYIPEGLLRRLVLANGVPGCSVKDAFQSTRAHADDGFAGRAPAQVKSGHPGPNVSTMAPCAWRFFMTLVKSSRLTWFPASFSWRALPCSRKHWAALWCVCATNGSPPAPCQFMSMRILDFDLGSSHSYSVLACLASSVGSFGASVAPALLPAPWRRLATGGAEATERGALALQENFARFVYSAADFGRLWSLVLGAIWRSLESRPAIGADLRGAQGEALLRATAEMPNCRSKSLKFVERPDVAQICKQHTLVTSAFQQILHHDGNLDLCIRCE